MHAQCLGRAWRRQLAHLVVVGMERERDERLQASGLVLQRPRSQHVIDTLFVRLDVTVEHREVATHAEPVRLPVDLEISLRAALVVADLPPYALSEDLGAAAWKRVESRSLQLAKHPL